MRIINNKKISQLVKTRSSQDLQHIAASSVFFDEFAAGSENESGSWELEEFFDVGVQAGIQLVEKFIAAQRRNPTDQVKVFIAHKDVTVEHDSYHEGRDTFYFIGTLEQVLNKIGKIKATEPEDAE